MEISSIEIMNSKETKNTLDGVELNLGRMRGNSTRQIDVAIYHLFNGFKVQVRDHWENGANGKANNDLFDRIIKRLQFEHNLDSLIKDKKIMFSKSKLTIALL